jgi:HEAT repeat protein
MIHNFCPFCWVEISMDERVCPRCNRNIEDWDEKSYVEKLMHSLNHVERSTMYRVCYILGERREKVALEPLIDLLYETNDHFLMEEIVEALGKIGDERAVPHLIKMLNENSFLVRGKAATVLGKFDAREEAIEALRRATTDCSTYVRELARASLHKLREGRCQV